MFVNRLLRYDWPFGCYLFNLCALCVIDLAVLLDEELVVTEELCALRFVLPCARAASSVNTRQFKP